MSAICALYLARKLDLVGKLLVVKVYSRVDHIAMHACALELQIIGRDMLQVGRIIADEARKRIE